MTVRPKIYVAKSGRRYFIVNYRKVFIDENMTKKQILRVYRLLKQSIPIGKSKKRTKQSKSKKAKSKVSKDPFVSTIDPKNRSTVSGSDHKPADSGDKDLLNKQTNEINKSKDLVDRQKKEIDRLTELANRLSIAADQARQVQLNPQRIIYGPDPEEARRRLFHQIHGPPVESKAQTKKR